LETIEKPATRQTDPVPRFGSYPSKHPNDNYKRLEKGIQKLMKDFPEDDE
jgi:hypothetical protein